MPEKSCPDCDAQMRVIKLIDATAVQPGRTGTRHVELAYAAVDAKAGFFGGHIKSEGTVQGLICEDCGRILLYGKPK